MNCRDRRQILEALERWRDRHPYANAPCLVMGIDVLSPSDIVDAIQQNTVVGESLMEMFDNCTGRGVSFADILQSINRSGSSNN